MKTEKIAPESIDEYISRFPVETKKLLSQLRTLIRETAPDAKEKISYQMPAFTLNGNLVYFAAYRNHIGFYPGSSGINIFKSDLSSYQTSKGTIRFPIGQPLPLDLIRKIVKFRMEENLNRI